MTLSADAERALASWAAPDEDQERLRLAYLRHLGAHPDAMWRSCNTWTCATPRWWRAARPRS